MHVIHLVPLPLHLLDPSTAHRTSGGGGDLTVSAHRSRGSFTVRKSRAGESFYLRVYGKLNHNIRCTLRGYRNLMGDFTGNTIYTGFKKIYTGEPPPANRTLAAGLTRLPGVRQQEGLCPCVMERECIVAMPAYCNMGCLFFCLFVSLATLA